MIEQGKARHSVQTAVLHCAAVPTNWYLGKTASQVVEIVGEWHRQRGWAGPGYHYVVMPDESVAPARPVTTIPAHVLGHNAGTLAILMVEHTFVDKVRRATDFFSSQQVATSYKLAARHGITDVRGHNDYTNAKICPGFKVGRDWSWLDDYSYPICGDIVKAVFSRR